jgi:hypothetical protein
LWPNAKVALDVNILDAARGSLAYTYAKKERNKTAAVSNRRSGLFAWTWIDLWPSRFQAMTVMVNQVFKGIPAKANANFLASLSVSIFLVSNCDVS